MEERSQPFDVRLAPVITGAASGRGEACAHFCSQQGAKVVLADRDQARGKNVAAAFKVSGDLAQFIATDVSNE
jgi:NADP-dependent 3-hydroxy acid dehydrogenase YdfG